MTLLFGVLLGIGVVYATVILIGGGLSHLDLPGIDFHPGDAHSGEIDLGGEVKMPSLSPIAIASFVTAFGAFGLIGQWLFNSSPVWSLASATIGGLTVAVLAHLAFTYFLIKPQGSSEVTMKDVVGAAAEVITPIPADSVGEVALVAQGGRVTYPAKSATGQAINRNTTVVVERMVGGIAFVRPQ
jgi:membrane protein implicated in regulation of membrane protease activity